MTYRIVTGKIQREQRYDVELISIAQNHPIDNIIKS